VENEQFIEAWYAADEDHDGVDSIEVLDELVFDTAPEDEPVAEQPEDPFATLTRAMELAAVTFGAMPSALKLLRALLGVTRLDPAGLDPAALDALVCAGFLERSAATLVRADRLTRQVLAWQDILRDKSDDLAACGAATLDEWASDLVARVIASGPRPDAVRRELRKHGVAAFGLLAAA
jgi:hypothetical protein